MFAMSSALPPQGGLNLYNYCKRTTARGNTQKNGEFKGKKQEIKTTITTKGG